MILTDELLNIMLYGSEGSGLDFKREQYKFIEATNDQKSELLKDILAMANAWESGERYIIIGVIDNTSKPNELVDISDHIDDATLQQFVNCKTNTPCSFSYNTVTHDGKTCGIIIIHEQQRPIYVKKDFGKVKKDSVYVRRGSSTFIAKLEEVVAMGNGNRNKKPELEINFYDYREGKILPKKIDITTTHYELNAKIPDYQERGFAIAGVNKDYYRDAFKYINFQSSYEPICFCINNNGNIEAKNIRIEITIKDTNIIIKKESQSTPRPDTSIFNNIGLNLNKELKADDFEIDVKKHETRLHKNISTIHAKRNFEIERIIYINPKETKLIAMEINIYCDGIEKPFTETLTLKCNHETKTISPEEFCEILNTLEL